MSGIADRDRDRDREDHSDQTNHDSSKQFRIIHDRDPSHSHHSDSHSDDSCGALVNLKPPLSENLHTASTVTNSTESTPSRSPFHQPEPDQEDEENEQEKEHHSSLREKEENEDKGNEGGKNNNGEISINEKTSSSSDESRFNPRRTSAPALFSVDPSSQPSTLDSSSFDLSSSSTGSSSHPSSSDLASILDLDVGSLTPSHVERLLSSYVDSYSIELISNPSTVPPSLLHLISDLFRAEGCALCGHQEFPLAQQQQQQQQQSTPVSIVLLSCKLLHCKHLVHLSCAVQQSKLAFASASGNSTLGLPRFESSHSTSFFRIIAFSSSSSTGRVPSLTPLDRPISNKKYQIEFSFLHAISNIQILQWNTTTQNKYIQQAYKDGKTGQEFVLIQFSSPASSTETNETPLASPSSLSSATPSPSSTTSSSLPSPSSSSSPHFSICRGQFYLKVLDASLPASSHTRVVCSHVCNFDLSTAQSSSSVMKLVMADAMTKNVITVGVQRNDKAQFVITYLKYQFHSNIELPNVVAPLQYSATGAVISSPSLIISPVPSSSTAAFAGTSAPVIPVQPKALMASSRLTVNPNAPAFVPVAERNAQAQAQAQASTGSTHPPHQHHLGPSSSTSSSSSIPANPMHSPHYQLPNGLMEQVEDFPAIGQRPNSALSEFHSTSSSLHYPNPVLSSGASVIPHSQSVPSSGRQSPALNPHVPSGPGGGTGPTSSASGTAYNLLHHQRFNSQLQQLAAEQNQSQNPNSSQSSSSSSHLLKAQGPRGVAAVPVSVTPNSSHRSMSIMDGRNRMDTPSPPPGSTGFGSHSHPHSHSQSPAHPQQGGTPNQQQPHRGSASSSYNSHSLSSLNASRPTPLSQHHFKSLSTVLATSASSSHHDQQQSQQQQQQPQQPVAPHSQYPSFLSSSPSSEPSEDWEADLASLELEDRKLDISPEPEDAEEERRHMYLRGGRGRQSDRDHHRNHNTYSSSTTSSRRNSESDSGENSPLFLPALPTFPMAPSGPNMPLLNLTVEQCAGNVVRLAKSHSGSRFVQQKLEARDPAFFSLFYHEVQDEVPALMVDNFGHFAIEKLIACCNDEQCLNLLQRLAPHIAVVACQKHGSFSVQALVDTLHTPAQIYTLVEAMRPEIMRIITHASGHFVVLRMLQRFPYASTKFIDDALVANCSVIGTDHHGLRVVKAVLAVRRSVELTRLFKQVARLTMKLVENQYGNYVIQAVLDVAPPGVRTNIKVKMEGKYMRLSKQKFSSNVVERCLKQSSSHWRTIIIRELTAQPAVSELLRDRYGNYVLQTALSVSNAQQVQEILRAISPYLPSLRDNVRSKWKKMLRKAGAGLQGSGSGFTPPDSPVDASGPPSPMGSSSNFGGEMGHLQLSGMEQRASRASSRDSREGSLIGYQSQSQSQNPSQSSQQHPSSHLPSHSSSSSVNYPPRHELHHPHSHSHSLSHHSHPSSTHSTHSSIGGGMGMGMNLNMNPNMNPNLNPMSMGGGSGGGQGGGLGSQSSSSSVSRLASDANNPFSMTQLASLGNINLSQPAFNYNPATSHNRDAVPFSSSNQMNPPGLSSYNPPASTSQFHGHNFSSSSHPPPPSSSHPQPHHSYNPSHGGGGMGSGGGSNLGMGGGGGMNQSLSGMSGMGGMNMSSGYSTHSQLQSHHPSPLYSQGPQGNPSSSNFGSSPSHHHTQSLNAYPPQNPTYNSYSNY